MTCFAPSELLDRLDASLFGAIAEVLIEGDYLAHVGRAGGFPTDFFDSRQPFQSLVLYRAFLLHHHPHLSPTELATLARGQTRIPDIMTHDDTNGLFEFYEIKPGSPDGLLEGQDKIAEIHALMHDFGLPYVPGTDYVPASEIEFFAGDALGVDLRMLLRVRKATDGVITYKVCADGGDFVPDFLLAAAVAAVLIAMIGLTRGQILRLVPA